MSYLLDAALEAEQVGELLQKTGFRAEVLSDYAAGEERFKALGQGAASPRILHVATHGFAYPDPKKTPQRGFAGDEPVYKIQDDPMLRSGLLPAGANHYWTAKRLFYENWVDKKESLRDAFNHAQATLREQEPSPYMWAGFVSIE